MQNPQNLFAAKIQNPQNLYCIYLHNSHNPEGTPRHRLFHLRTPSHRTRPDALPQKPHDDYRRLDLAVHLRSLGRRAPPVRRIRRRRKPTIAPQYYALSAIQPTGRNILSHFVDYTIYMVSVLVVVPDVVDVVRLGLFPITVKGFLLGRGVMRSVIHTAISYTIITSNTF